MKYHLTLIEGDGIGPEVMDAAVRILDAAGVEIVWERVIAGKKAVDRYGSVVPEGALESIERNRVALKGPVTTPVGRGFPSANVTLRKKLELYACIRPVKNLPGIETRFGNVDIVVVRENTEGLYSGLEHEVVPGVITSSKIITRRACRRIAKYAFEYCRNKGRKNVTAVHKANVMRQSDGLFLEEVKKVADDYPFIDYEEIAIDSIAMNVVMNPEDYDVLLMLNLYGDIMSDLTSGLVGGLGVVPGANIGDLYAVFEPVHGSAPDIEGKGIANPLAAILSSALMLEHLGESRAANRIREAVFGVLADGNVKTPDLGGKSGTDDFTNAIIGAL